MLTAREVINYLFRRRREVTRMKKKYPKSKKGHLFIEHIIEDVEKDKALTRIVSLSKYYKRLKAFIKRI
jgi:hypothetical protein